MKASKTQQTALIGLLNRTYQEIAEVEGQWGIHAADNDYRPRIEYFHDAVRSYSEREGHGIEGHGRLSIEMLAYDIGMLRFIQAEPIPRGHKPGKLSAETGVAHSTLPRMFGDKTGVKPDASVRNRLADLYKNYAVLFAALLANAADYNYMTRINEGNAQVEDLAALLQSVKEQGAAEIDLEALMGAEIMTPELINKLFAALRSGTLKKRMGVKEAQQKLKEIEQEVEKEIKAIEQAHMNYATGQLAIYEHAKETVKKMATKGFNIVGAFVESAVREAQRGGRGI